MGFDIIFLLLQNVGNLLQRSAGFEFWSDFSKAGDAGAGGLQGQGQNVGRSSLRALQRTGACAGDQGGNQNPAL